MKNRLTELFEKKKKDVLAVYYTAGYPSLHDTEIIGKTLIEAGTDIIEIGIPFSDPIADGPVIQASNKEALDKGMQVSLLLEQVKALRSQVSAPIVLMGYLNPVYQYGIHKFLNDAKAAGVDGLILPDLPAKEFEDNFKATCESLDLSVIFLLTPTTSAERRHKVDQLSTGFIYAVSASSTTGNSKSFDENQLHYFETLKTQKWRSPVLIGFGISNHETFSQACQYSAGAIVGSAFIKALEQSKDIKQTIQTFVKALRGNL